MNHSNNGFSVLSGAVAPGDTVITLAAGTGSRFPASDFLATLIGYDEVGNENKWEICKCSSRVGDVLTVARAQEGTTASAWPDATRIENRVTAGTMAGFVSKNGVETLANKTLTNPVINGITGDASVVNLGGGQFYKDTNGSVGIGTSTPGSLYSLDHILAIVKNQNAISRVTLVNNVVGASAVAAYKIIGGTDNSFLDLGLADNNGAPYGALTMGPAVQRLSISLGGSERFRLGPNGELGVGGANFGSAGQALISSGPGAAPTWGAASASIKEIDTPANTSPANSAAGVIETPQLTGSPYYEIYGASQSAIQVQVSTSSSFSSPLYSSGDQAAGTSFTLPPGILSTSTQYYWRIRYKSARGTYSDWSTPTSFATEAQFNSYIPVPAATPSNFGDALEGGFYAGMIWNELVQSATSTTISTGSKTFTVPSMSGAPIVYAGQQLEVRSRANPANKMVGTVTGAAGTGLTLNVTSAEGSGTFADWSIMSRYRVIVAPKASGENASVIIKNTTTSLPTACQTLTEGLRATQAMRDADTSVVYPAAHWARGLSIGGWSDWYIPARDELELCWRNLKPVTNDNYVNVDRPTGASFNYANDGSYGDTANTHGRNNNSDPVGAAYTASVPGQTAATAFRTGGAEAYEFGSSYYWSSSEYDASLAWSQYWNSSSPGYQSTSHKTGAYRVRAVRRSVI